MEDSERFKLLHGPYAPPALRRGDTVECEYRGCEVKVGGLTDGRIPWPRLLKNGKPALIVCGDLARAVRSESELAISYWWGVSVTTIWKWRQALDVPRMNEGTGRLYREYQPEKIDDEAYAKMTATHRTPALREKHRLAKLGRPVHPRTAESLLEAAKRPKTEEHRRAMSESHRKRLEGVPRKSAEEKRAAHTAYVREYRRKRSVARKSQSGPKDEGD